MNTMIKTSVLSVGFLALGIFAQAQTKTERRELSPFTKLEAGSAANVKLVKSDTPYVIVEADEDVISKIGTKVQNNELEITYEGKKTNGFKVTVAYKDLTEIESTGAASIGSDAIFSGTDLKIEASGASKVKLDVDLKKIDANVSGAASLILKGKADMLDADVSGAASLKAANLVAQKAELSVSGAATGSVQAITDLKGEVSGAGTLKYIGNPTNKALQKSGAGNIKIITEEGSANEETKVTVITQEAGKENADTTKINFGSRKIYIVEGEDDHTSGKKKEFFDDEFNHWSGVELAQSGWMTWDNKFTLPSRDKYMEIDYGFRNISWNLNLFEKDFRIIQNHMQLVTGLGFSFNNYQFRNRTTLNADSSYTWYRKDSLIDFKKNRLKVNYLSVPLMLEFNTSKNNERHNFHIALGAIGYVKLNSKLKQTYSVNGDNKTNVRKDDFNLSPFRVDATARIGYNNFTLFATYGLTEMFQKDRGPQVYPFQVGLRIVPF